MEIRGRNYNLDELDQIMLACAKSTRKFARFFFPETFRQPFDRGHGKMFGLLRFGDRITNRTSVRPFRKKVMAAPRGVGKTSIFKAFMSQLIVFRMSRFIVYTSSSQEKAIRETENVKLGLRANEIVRMLFGDVKLRDESVRDDKFSKKEWVANDYTIIVPRGGEQDHRGLLWKDWRPNVLINDDCQDKLTINTTKQVQRLVRW